MKNALLRAEVELEVPFHDLDPLEVAWHGHYAKYLELARCALLRRFEYDYPQMRASGYAWPVVELRIKYVRPLRYGQAVRVVAGLAEWENRLRIVYEVRDAATGARLTTAQTIQVAVEVATGELQFVAPPTVRERLRHAGVAV